MALADPEELEGTKTLGHPVVSRDGVTVVHSGTVEPEIFQSEVGTSEVGMAGVVVDLGRRSVGSTAGSEDAMTVAVAEE